MNSQNPSTGGEVVVPREPTVEMLNAAIDVDSFKLGDISPLGFRISPQMLFAQCWKAMIEASPLLVAGGGSGSLAPLVPGRENDALSANILAALETDAAVLLLASNNRREKASERTRYAHLYGGLTRAIRIAKEVIAK